MIGDCDSIDRVRRFLNQQSSIDINSAIVNRKYGNAGNRSLPDALAVIDRARGYDINHLELSHEVVMDLREIRDPTGGQWN
jgi:hypothetical protein